MITDSDRELVELNHIFVLVSNKLSDTEHSYVRAIMFTQICHSYHTCLFVVKHVLSSLLQILEPFRNTSCLVKCNISLKFLVRNEISRFLVWIIVDQSYLQAVCTDIFLFWV